jgi:aryl-alcohol dehydrogenase-like predicted oxidoreductase
MQVSLLGLGTVKLGRHQQVKYPDPFVVPDDRAAATLLNRARELGVNLIDTAPAYGTSEERLGTLLRNSRREWIICSKVGEEFDGATSRFDFTPEHVQFSVRRSLQRLSTDYLDVVLIHSDGNDVEILNGLGTLEALRDLKQQGCIRSVGISHKTVAGAERALALDVEVIMATLNRSEPEQAELIAKAGAQSCGVLIKKPLASGQGTPENLAWVAAHSGVSSIVTGTIDPDHLIANAAALAASG